MLWATSRPLLSLTKLRNLGAPLSRGIARGTAIDGRAESAGPRVRHLNEAAHVLTALAQTTEGREGATDVLPWPWLAVVESRGPGTRGTALGLQPDLST